MGGVEGADEVFAGGQVDGDFAADAAVDLGEQGGGDLDEGDAAGVGGGDEADEVADTPSTEGDEGFAAFGALGGEPVVDAGGDLKGLAFLAGTDRVCVHAQAGGGEGVGYAFSQDPHDIVVRAEEDAAGGGDFLDDLAGAGEEAAGDGDAFEGFWRAPLVGVRGTAHAKGERGEGREVRKRSRGEGRRPRWWSGWVRGRPLTDCRRGRRCLPLPLERVKSGGPLIGLRPNTVAMPGAGVRADAASQTIAKPEAGCAEDPSPNAGGYTGVCLSPRRG